MSVVGSARTHFAISINLHVPLKKISCGYGRGESGNSVGLLEQLVVGDHGETDEDAGKKQTSKVRVSMLFLVLPRWRSPGLSCRVFNFSEIVRRKGMEGQTSSEGVIGTARPPQCEFSNIHTSLAFGLLE